MNERQPVRARVAVRGTVERALGALIGGGLLVAVVISATTGPPPEADLSASSSVLEAPNAGAAELPADLVSLIDKTRFVGLHTVPEVGGHYFVGSLAGRHVDLAVAPDAVVRIDAGRVVITEQTTTETVVSLADPEIGETARIYATNDGVTAEVIASLSSDRRTLWLAGLDLGLLRVDLETGATRQLVEPGTVDLEGPLYALGELHWSPTGDRVLFVRCGIKTCHSDLVTAAGEVVAIIDNFVPEALSGVAVLGYEDIDRRGWVVLDAATGTRRPVDTGIGAIANDGYPLDDGTFVAWGEAEGAMVYSVIDSGSATARIIYRDAADAPRIADLWTSVHWALMIERDVAGTVSSGRPLDILDLQDGSIIRGAVPPGS